MALSRFNCINCDALYEVKYVEDETVAVDHELACVRCGAPLQARQGRFVLKYLPLDSHSRRAVRRRRWR
jgi:uncharacterized paraquat-inducible protein A